ncbi:hypothetical protein ACQEU6_07450 [Spirillospora sp. CA-108201]
MKPTVQAEINGLIDGFIDSGDCDIADIALFFPARVFLAFSGLPMDDLDSFIRWQRVIAGGADPGSDIPRAEVRAATEELETYFEDRLEEFKHGRKAPDGLFRRILAEAGDGERLTDRELLGLAFLFVLAGLGTVASALTTMFGHLA